MGHVRFVAGFAAGVFALSVCACSAVEPGAPPPAVDAPAWDGDFEPGPFSVGFRSESIMRDGADGPRELVLSVWYPAAPDGDGEPLVVGDYFDVVLQEEQLTETQGLPGALAYTAALTGSAEAIPPERAREGLGAPTLARRNAAPAQGSFPIALWSSRHATVLAQAPLSEILASHGFVTASVWSSDPPLAFLWEDHPAADKLATIEWHTGDLQHALAELRNLPAVDGSRTVALAWSYGGQTAARIQERDDGVVGVIALDANVVPARAEESLDLRQPLVYLVGSATGNRGFERLDRLTAPWVAVRFTELAHGSFNAMEGYLPAVLGATTVYSWSQPGAVARDGYMALVRVVTTAAQTLTGQTTAGFSALSDEFANAAGSVSVEILTRETRSP